MRRPLPPPSPPLRARGFTLLELMVGVPLSALVLGLAAPALDRLVAAQRLRTTSFNLVSDLTLARSESLKRSAPVQLAPATTGWPDGWSVQVVANGQVLGRRQPLGPVQVTQAPTRIVFNDRGQLDAADPVRISLADGHGGGRCIVLDPSGRPRAMPTSCTE